MTICLDAILKCEHFLIVGTKDAKINVVIVLEGIAAVADQGQEIARPEPECDIGVGQQLRHICDTTNVCESVAQQVDTYR